MTNNLHKLISLVSFINDITEGNYKTSDFYYDSNCLFLKNDDEFDDEYIILFDNGVELNLYHNVVCAFSHITNKNMLPIDIFDIDLHRQHEVF